MTKDEAATAWREATEELERIKTRHKVEIQAAKERFRETRDAFIAAAQAEAAHDQAAINAGADNAWMK